MSKQPEEYEDIPGTWVFDAERARRGYHLNAFFYSLMKAENRAEFLADERRDGDAQADQSAANDHKLRVKGHGKVGDMQAQCACLKVEDVEGERVALLRPAPQ